MQNEIFIEMTVPKLSVYKIRRQCHVTKPVHQCFPIFFWQESLFLTNKFLSPPYHP